MSDAGAADDGEYEGGRPFGLYLLVGVIVALVAVSGMFAIGYIPPLAKVGTHATTTHSGSVQFITVTSTEPGAITTQTQTVRGINTTSISTTTSTTTVAGANTTTTQTLTQILTHVVVSTTTTSTTVLVPTTTTSTLTTTTTTTVAPIAPLTINITMDPPANPATLYPGESFTIGIAVHNTLPSTNLSISAHQTTPGQTPLVMSFYPLLPENVVAVVGNSFYTIQGNVSQNAPVGNYEVDVVVNANSLQNGTVTSVLQQSLMQILEPISFTGYNIVNSTQFSGACKTLNYMFSGNTAWVWQCGINASPSQNGTITFSVTNLASVPICIQTYLQSSTVTGYVKMNPYPFCPGGATGVYVPAGVTNWVFTYAVLNGGTAGAQTVFFKFLRAA